MTEKEFKKHLWNQGFYANSFTFTRKKGLIVICYGDKVLTIAKKLEQDIMDEILEYFEENDMYPIRFMDQDNLVLIFKDKVINFDSLIQIDHSIEARNEILNRAYRENRFAYYSKGKKSELEDFLVKQGYCAYKNKLYQLFKKIDNKRKNIFFLLRML